MASSSNASDLPATEPLTEESVQSWLLSQDPPILDWKKTPFQAIRALIQHGELEKLQFLALPKEVLRLHIDMNQRDHRTVHLAAKWGRLDILKWLVEEQDVPLYDTNRRSGGTAGETYSPQYHAAANGHLECLVWMQGYGPNRLTYENYWQLINESAMKGHPKVLAWLLDHGFENTTPEKYRITMLCSYALTSGHAETVELLEARGLLKMKSLVKSKNVVFWLPNFISPACDDNVAPLDYAVSRGWKPKLTSELKKALPSLLGHAVSAGSKKFIAWFIDRGLYPTDAEHQEHLFKLAVSRAPYDIVQYLLPYGRFMMDSMKSWPFSIFASCGYNADVEVPRWLNRIGCAFTPEIEENMLMNAARAGSLEVVKWLSLGSPLSNNLMRHTVILHATMQRHTRVIRFLVEELDWPVKDLDFNNRKTTLLHHAVQYGDLETVMWLVESKRIDVNDPTGGVRPMGVSSWLSGVTECIFYLRAMGGSDSSNRPPLPFLT